MGSGVRLVLPIAIPNLCSPPPTIIKSMKEISKLRFWCIKIEVYLVKVLNAKSLSEKALFQYLPCSVSIHFAYAQLNHICCRACEPSHTYPVSKFLNHHLGEAQNLK